MHRETMVLTVPAETVNFLYEGPDFWPEREVFDSVRSLIRNHGVFVDRLHAEANPRLKQIVSFAIVHRGNKLFSLQRSRRDPRVTLRLRHTLLFGGHVGDAEAESERPAEDSLARELFEELGLQPKLSPLPVGVIAEPRTESGFLHLGLIYQVANDSECASVPALESEFDIADPKREVQMIPWSSIPPLVDSLDHWSSLLLYEGVLDSLLNAPVRKFLPPQAESTGRISMLSG